MEFYNVGKIVNTQGLRGEVRVMSITDFPEKRFQVGNKLYAFKADGLQEELTIDGVRTHKNFILLHFKNKPTINDVEYLKPSELKISASQQMEDDLGPGEYYYHQIIGLKVQDIDGNYVGTVKEILSPGANDVWVVQRNNKSDLLLPKIDSVILKVDLNQQLIIVDIPRGLDDEN
jgi:16S rRNA processing protein RimM